MIDKISGQLPAGYTREAAYSKEVSSGVTKGKTPTVSGTAPTTDAVELSNQAQLLQKAMQSAQDEPEVRADVVQEIKGQIETGNYSVNHQEIADKIISLLV